MLRHKFRQAIRESQNRECVFTKNKNTSPTTCLTINLCRKQIIAYTFPFGNNYLCVVYKGDLCYNIFGDVMERKHNKELTANARVLRKNMTKEERHLWYDFLRTYDIKFYRQKAIDGFIVDFYCHSARLVIELDGSQHYTESEFVKDKTRTEKIEERNLTVIRIPNNYVNTNFRGVCEYIDNIVKQKLHEEQ